MLQAAASASAATIGPAETGFCNAPELPVESTVRAPTAYQDFCRANSGECELGGPTSLFWDPALQGVLERINTQVNAEIRFIPDMENLGREEVWNYPDSGWGDCLRALVLPSMNPSLATMRRTDAALPGDADGSGAPDPPERLVTWAS